MVDDICSKALVSWMSQSLDVRRAIITLKPHELQAMAQAVIAAYEVEKSKRQPEPEDDVVDLRILLG